MQAENIKTTKLPPLLFKQKKNRESIAKICQEHDIVQMAIFGSVARGNQTSKSDIDILITFRKGTTKTLFDLVTIENQLKKVFKRKIDLVTPDGLSPLLKKEILSKARIIYAE
ncbi:MAG: nucleotidyltransferase family protein [Phycisphaerae bacterium]|jgi:predicted nucleotidyltransferase|nr:nucleotidyltransferase family protein [Phycisphaerae bacterium]